MGSGIIAVGAVVVAISVGQWWWRRERARAVVDAWLAVHRYRPREISIPWRPGPFVRSLWRDEDRTVVFRAVVDDLRLGGTGIVWLRVWSGWLGGVNTEPDVDWEEIPTGAGPASQPIETRWADAQVELLRRVSGGETSFYPARGVADAGEAFDHVAEHILALQRRGLLRCAAPSANLRGDSQYAAITDVQLTAEGRKALEKIEGGV